MQSSNVVRGSTRSRWSLPLTRSVIGTAPGMFGPSAFAGGESLGPAACAGAQTAINAAAAVSPVVRRNARRLGFDGTDGGSSRMGASFPWKVSLSNQDANVLVLQASTVIELTRLSHSTVSPNPVN